MIFGGLSVVIIKGEVFFDSYYGNIFLLSWFGYFFIVRVFFALRRCLSVK